MQEWEKENEKENEKEKGSEAKVSGWESRSARGREKLFCGGKDMLPLYLYAEIAYAPIPEFTFPSN